MKTNSILILALVLIVVIVLFNNNKQESFDVFDTRNLTNITQEDMKNGFEVLLFLSENCEDCKKYIEVGDIVIRRELRIPDNIRIRKVVLGNNDSEKLFQNFGIVNVPAAVINHPKTGIYKISDVSSNAIRETIHNIYEQIMQDYFYTNRLS